MNIPRCHDDLSALHIGCEAPRAYFIPYESREKAFAGERDSSAFFKNLSGEWSFCFYESFDLIEGEPWSSLPADGDKIIVPKCWQTYTSRNYDKPLYSNLRYPFPVDPPHIPNENPCGLYSRVFSLDDAVQDKRYFVNFEGVSSCFYLFINGCFAAYSQVSHCTSEIDITDLIHGGENLISVLVLKWCDGSYLEDQDFFRLSGIFRDVYILTRPKNCLRDIILRQEVSEKLDLALITADVNTDSGVEIKYELLSPDGKNLAFGSADGSFEISISEPVLWNDESPKQYSLLLTAADEFFVFEIALRRIEIKDRALLLNGKKLKLRGINRHDSHPETGYAVSAENMLEDLMLLKRANCNTIRTSHYPNDPRFAEMCERLGFYLIDEADLETHGMGYNNDDDWDWFRWSLLSSSPEWREAYIDRARRLFERDKNRGCVLMWSLGNESGCGVNHRAMKDYIKSRSPKAIVHYENAHLQFKAVPDGECFADISDVESRMYPDIEYTEEYLNDETHTKPFFLCEYVCSMTTGDVYANWDLVEKYDNFCGGCIWELTDHAVAVTGADGKAHYCYGGDFGDYPNDKTCCVDGLVYPDRRLRPGYYDMKRVYQQFSSVLSALGKVKISSRRCFESLDDIDFSWKLESDGKTVLSGEKVTLSLAPREEKEFTLFNKLPVGLHGACCITLIFTQNKSTQWADKGFETGFEQFIFDAPAPEKALPAGKVDFSKNGRIAKISAGSFCWAFDLSRGKIVSLKKDDDELLKEPFEFDIWHAPTINGGISQWTADRFDHMAQTCLSAKTVEAADGMAVIETEITVSAPSSPPTVRAKVTYTFAPDGSVSVLFEGKVRENAPLLPKFGLRLMLDGRFSDTEFLGFGPFEAYVDRHRAAKFGLHKMKIDDNFEHYIFPQENSAHYGTRRAEVTAEDVKITFTPLLIKDFCFNASRFTPQMLTAAQHDRELKPLDATVVCLDYKINSISLNSQIAKLETERFFDDKELRFGFKIQPSAK